MYFLKHTLKNLVIVNIFALIAPPAWSAGLFMGLGGGDESDKELSAVEAHVTTIRFKEMLGSTGYTSARAEKGGRRTFHGGGSGASKESRAEYAERKERSARGTHVTTIRFKEMLGSKGYAHAGSEKGGQGTFHGGGSGALKESPAEYAARKARSAMEKLERTRSYAESLGLTVHSYMSLDDINKEIQSKKDRDREEYAARKERSAEERLERTRSYAESLGIKVYSYMSIEDINKEIQSKKDRDREARGARSTSSLWSPGPTSYRIGSTSDPEAAKRIVDEMREKRASGARLTYKESLRERHAALTLGGTDASLSRHSDTGSWSY